MEPVAIIGVGSTGFRTVTPDVSYKEMMYEAAVRAYEDAGIDPRRDADCLTAVAEDFYEGTSIFDEYTPDQLGFARKPVHTITGDGLQGLASAVMQVQTGIFEVAVVEGHSKQSDVLTMNAVQSQAVDPVSVRPLGGHPQYIAGLEMRRYLHESGTTEEQCAAVVVKNKANALANPHAGDAARVTREDVLASAPLFSPLRALERSTPVDGSVVVVIANAAKAKQFTDTPVWIRGISYATDSPTLDSRAWGETVYAQVAARLAYKAAGLDSPRQSVDFAEVDDSFAYKELMHLEAIGLARKGEAGQLTAEGVTARDGGLPVNPSGGCLGMGYPYDASGLQRAYEAVVQLRGEAGKRQVDGAELAVCQSWRGVPTATGAVAVLGRDPR